VNDDSFSSDSNRTSNFLNGQRMSNSGGVPPTTSGSPSPAPGAPCVDVAVVPGGVSAGPAGATAGPAQATPGQATTPGATAGPAGATVKSPVLAPAPPGTLAQGSQVQAPPSSGPRGTLAQGLMPATPQQWDPQSALEFAKHVQNWAKGHAAAAALRDHWGANFPTPGATQSAQPGFSPQVQSLLARLRTQGWSNVQVPGVGHVIRHPSGKSFVFHPENGSLTPFNSTPSLAQGVG